LLTRPRPLVALHRDVVDMREKMRAQKLGQNDHGQWMNKTGFQLKHDRGGIVDIEFMVQYAVLAWSHTHPSLARWSDNIRILDAMADVGLISSEERTALQDAYIAFRGAAHRKALQHEASVVSAEYFQTHRQAVALVWQRLMVDDSSAEQE
jgi:glutamate-ammonia-ligase adenylyltransferase